MYRYKVELLYSFFVQQCSAISLAKISMKQTILLYRPKRSDRRRESIDWNEKSDLYGIGLQEEQFCLISVGLRVGQKSRNTFSHCNGTTCSLSKFMTMSVWMFVTHYLVVPMLPEWILKV